MKENWVICHDNGVPGQRGFSDGYISKFDAETAANTMKNNGIEIFEIWRTE